MLQHLIPLYQALLMVFLLLQTSCGNEEMADNQAKDTDASASIKNTLPPMQAEEEPVIAIIEPLPIPIPTGPTPFPYPILRGGGGHGRPQSVCGNSRLEKGEGCDDGNIVGGDGCSPVCELEFCGNGAIDSGEECDDGNIIGGDGCSSDCILEFCGSGIIDSGEECDDGNITDGDGCNSDCKLEFCGNAIIDVGEECDPQSSAITCDENEACENCQCISLVSYSDLSINKIGNRLEVGLGQALSYTITITNNGPDAAANVVVTDTLPSEVTFVSATGCSHSSGIVTCNIASLANSASQNFEIHVTVNQDASGSLDNLATVTSDSVDQDADNNSDSYTAYVVTTTDLQLTKTVDNSQPIPEATIAYTLQVANLGDVIESINLSVQDILPVGVTFVSATSSSFTCNETTGTITCTLASLAPSATASITINVTVNAMSGAEITNTADLFADNDSDGSNNSGSATINVTTPAPQLVISKNIAPNPPIAGQLAFYIIQLENTGTATATGIVVTDTLPAGFTFQSTNNGCTHSSGVITCNIASLASGALFLPPILIQGTFSSAGEETNLVTVDDDDAGSDPNDSFTLITEVSPPPILSK
jgi:uncharacterized repeat protein (TIGR01451 family)